MPTWMIILIVVVAVAVLGAVIWLVTQEMQRKRLQQRFGPEYDRTVAEKDSPRAAQRELAERERRHKELDIRPLSTSARERYVREWAQVQEKFVDEPAPAVAEADQLLTSLMAERGYPTEGYEQQVADLSVRHAKTLEHYRAAHTTQQKPDGASTEDLRDAMVRYRTVFEDLLTDGAGDEQHDHHDRRNGHDRTEQHATERRDTEERATERRDTGRDDTERHETDRHETERQASANPRTEWNGGR